MPSDKVIKLYTAEGFLKKYGSPNASIEDLFANVSLWDIPSDITQNIIHKIEGVDTIQGGIQAKFSQEILSVDKLSSGCKTALCIAGFQYKGIPEVVDITECGPVALDFCLDLLAGSCVSGSFYGAQVVPDLFKKRNILLDNLEFTCWFDILNYLEDRIDEAGI